MSEDGKNMLKAVQEVRKLFQQISLLLENVDGQMKKRGWNAYDNITLDGSSSSLELPKQWLPCTLFRFYKNDKHKNILIFVSILLDNDVFGYYNGIIEPLITWGVLDYGQDKEVSDDFEYWYAKWHGYIENRKDDGSIHESEKDWKDSGHWRKIERKGYHFNSYKCFGIPLTSVTNQKDIESKVVKPLLDQLPK